MTTTSNQTTRNQIDRITDALGALRLPIMVERFKQLIDEGVSDDLGFLDLLWMLIEPQLVTRRNNAIERRIKQARFPSKKSLDNFDFDFQPSLDRQLVLQLATLDFIRKGRNLLLGGMSGTGKSHIAISLGHLACAHGFRTRYTTSAAMLQGLHTAAATDNLDETIKRFRRPQLLIIDEVGIDKSERERSFDASLFYKVVAHRYEASKSSIITTNIDWEDWGGYLGNDSVAAAAILDRLVHHGYAISIKGPSWRAHQHSRLNDELRASLED